MREKDSVMSLAYKYNIVFENRWKIGSRWRPSSVSIPHNCSKKWKRWRLKLAEYLRSLPLKDSRLWQTLPNLIPLLPGKTSFLQTVFSATPSTLPLQTPICLKRLKKSQQPTNPLLPNNPSIDNVGSKGPSFALAVSEVCRARGGKGKERNSKNSVNCDRREGRAEDKRRPDECT